jgi:hypothetical protein
LAAASVVTAGIPLVFYLNGPRANWLAHYCSTCGIRLTTYIQEGGAVFPLNSSMLELPRADSPLASPNLIKSPTSSRTTHLPARLARSPLGPAPLKVDFRGLITFSERHRSLFPDLILDVDWNRYLDMPVALRNLGSSTKIYEVQFPDFDLDGKLNPVMFWPSKRDPHYFTPLVWTPERSHVRVVSPKDAKREVGLVQLAQAEWDVGMYFPKHAATASAAAAPPKPVGYDFRHQEVGLNHFVFARAHPHFVWSSSEGPLLWTIQRTADGLCEGQVAYDRLVLLDCYDRLVAMEHCKYDARWREWDTVSRGHVFESHLNLRFYGGLSGKMVDEVVVSYVAVSAQMRRKGEWDVVNIETD